MLTSTPVLGAGPAAITPFAGPGVRTGAGRGTFDRQPAVGLYEDLPLDPWRGKGRQKNVVRQNGTSMYYPDSQVVSLHLVSYTCTCTCVVVFTFSLFSPLVYKLFRVVSLCGYIQADATGSWIRPYGSLYIQAGATGSWIGP